MNTNKLINKLSSYFSKHYKNISFVGISRNEYLKKVKDIINKSIGEYKNEEDLENNIKKNVQKHINNYVKEKLESDFITVMDRFLDENISNGILNLSSVLIFNKLNNLFQDVNFELSFEMIEELFNKSDKFNILVNDYYLKHKNIILNNKLESITDNQLLISTVSIYCELNDILIDDMFTIKDNSFFDDGIYSYLKEVGSIPLMTKEEVKQLGVKIKSGSKSAKDELISRNLRLVVSIANKFKYCGLDFLDVIQEGNIGLMTAVDKFDFDKDISFSTYATWWIRQSILRGIKEKGKLIRLPSHMHEKETKYKKALNHFESELGRTPSREEIMKYCKFNENEMDLIESTRFSFTSGQVTVDDSEDVLFITTIPSPDASIEDDCFDKSMIDAINKLIYDSNLYEDELYVLQHRFGLGGCDIETLEEIGKHLNITRERVRQIENKTVDRLRHNKDSQALACYLEDEEFAVNSLLGLRKNSKRKLQSRTIYEYFPDVDKEKIDNALSMLRKDQIEIIHKKFGDDLEHPVYADLDAEDKNEYQSKILPTLKKNMRESLNQHKKVKTKKACAN